MSADVGAGIGPNRSTSPRARCSSSGSLDARGELLVAAQPQALVGDVVAGQERGHRQRHGDLRGRFDNGLALQ